MAKRKKKVIIDPEASAFKKRHGRFPSAKATEFHKDKTKYNRRTKHKNKED